MQKERMTDTQHLIRPDGETLAFKRVAGDGATVVWIGGFRSDMEGTKALALDAAARQGGWNYVRYDHFAHGVSSGDWRQATIGRWRQDAIAMIDALNGPVIPVGSSMGGWISLLLARAFPERVGGLVTVAAAPDFTERGFWAGFSELERAKLMREGRLLRPSDYGEPYPITRKLIEDGRNHLVLRSPLALPFPVRLLQGTADPDVPMDWALRLLDHAQSPDLHLTLVKGADHRFSTPECLALIGSAVEEVLA